MSIKKYDIREIRFIKTNANNSLFKLGYQNDSLLCFGHYDIVRVIRASGEDTEAPLSRISRHAQQIVDEKFTDKEQNSWNAPNSNYLHSLFVIKDISCTQSMDDFWQTDSRYVLIARIHCDLPAKSERIQRGKMCFNNSESVFVQALTSSCKDYCLTIKSVFHQNQSEFKFQVPNTKEFLSGCFYESLELGDIVGAFKCNTLMPMVKLVQFLYENIYVSDLYSYVGLDYSVVEKIDFASEEKALKNTPVPAISTRFSIRRAAEADRFLEKYTSDIDKLNYVTGTADASITWGINNEFDFLQKIKTIIEKSKQDCGSDKIHFHEAFFEAITRFGIEYRKPTCSREVDLASERLVTFDRVVQFKWLYSDKTQLPTQWGTSLKRLLSVLRSMSANSVMDDLASMLIPSVRALLERIKSISTSNDDSIFREQYSDDISYFLDNWTRLSNDLWHLESQMSQHPELGTVAYPLPAMILQYLEHFVRQTAEILGGIETRHFEPVIFPRMIDHIQTRCVLDPRTTIRAYCCPLSIEIPPLQLYQPWNVAHILAHEVAHYCGEESRMRDLRLACMLDCTVIMIIKLWDTRAKHMHYYRANLSHFQSSGPSLQADTFLSDKIRHDILGKYHKLVPNGESPSLLGIMKKYFPIAAYDVATKNDKFELYRDILMKGSSAADQLAYAKIEYWASDSGWFTLYSDALLRHCDLLTNLCKECYADIIMILLLHCNIQDYYNIVFGTELNRLKEQGRTTLSTSMLNRHLYRMELVAHVIGRSICDWDAKLSEFKVSFEANIEIDKAEQKDDLKDYAGYVLFPEEFQLISSYLLECANNFNRLMSIVDIRQKVLKLREELNSIHPDHFEWAKMRRYSEGEAQKWRDIIELRE